MRRRAVSNTNTSLSYNTIIGGQGAITTTASALATLLGISVGNITYFNLNGNDIEAFINTNYSIPSNCFSGNTTITSYIDVDGLVTSTQYRAFYNATGLITVDLHATTIITGETFNGCLNLETIDLEGATEIGNLTFQNCRKVLEYYLPNVGITSGTNPTGIWRNNFLCETIYAPGLNFHGSNNARGKNLCQNCYALTSINIDSVTWLGDAAFNNCTSLPSISLPSLTKLTAQLFLNTPALLVIDIPLVDGTGTNMYQTFQQCGVQNLDLSGITNGTQFTNDAFYNTYGLLTLDISGITNAILGSTVGADNALRNITTGVQITAPISLQTNNSGSPDGDLTYAISSRGATVIYV